MPANQCPFSRILAASLCQCPHAEEVVRRGGSEFDCRNEAALPLCTELGDRFKRLALPVLGYEDDLTKTPQSIYERVQAGGLIGLQASIASGTGTESGSTAVPDIWSVVDTARRRAGSIDAIPADDFVPAIEHYKSRRRRRK